jgi:hypothetical protein
MAEKHLVCQGAICMCKYGTTPDKLKVLSHQKEYINDPDGSQKLVATTKEIGSTFENNTFGSCKKQNNNPCAAAVLEWKDFYKDVTLSNEGNILLEDSTATCPIGGSGCISIQFHGQVSEPAAQNEQNADDDVMAQLYPFGDLKNKEDTQIEDESYVTI